MVDVEREGPVARIFLNRPEKANALSSRVLQDLAAAIEKLHDVCKAIRDLPVPVVARLHGAVIGAGLEIAAAWLVLTGEAIDARRALEWGLVEEVSANLDLALEKRVKSLLAAGRDALRAQKQLLQPWDEAPLATAVAASIEAFSRTTISSTEGPKGH